ncbi:MAG: tetratricopeptide repeat protein [Pseudomonadota bacterium]
MTGAMSTLRKFCIGLVATAPMAAFAAGGNGGGSGGGGGGGGEDRNASPPARTETTQNCFRERQWDPETGRYVRFTQAVNGVWDPDTRRCIRPDKAGYLNSRLLGDAVRELAYAGRFSEAQDVLAQMDPSDGLVLTYLGFTHRKLGDPEAARFYYERALEIDPDNFLARSYMGQGFVEDGKVEKARVQLSEIRARGGRGTWAEYSLRSAIGTGVTYAY